jgi:hypothetical protein
MKFILQPITALYFMFLSEIWQLQNHWFKKKITEHCMRPTLGTKLEHSTRLSVTAALLDE